MFVVGGLAFAGRLACIVGVNVGVTDGVDLGGRGTVECSVDGGGACRVDCSCGQDCILQITLYNWSG